MVANKKLRRLVDAVHEYKEWFPRYCESVMSSLVIVGEINGYIRERCAASLSQKTIRQLDEILRDICIIHSRCQNLQMKLDLCVIATRRARVFARTKKSPEAVEQRIKECCDCVVEWSQLKTEFQTFFGAVENKWNDVETAILEKYDK